MSKRSKAKFEFSSFAKAVALIVLALVVAILCVLAIRHGRGNQQAASPEPTATVAPVAVPTTEVPTPTPTATPKGEPEEVTAVPAAQILAAIDEESAYRAIVGSCSGGGSVIEATSDGGATWRPFDVSDRLGIGGIQALAASGNGYGFFLGFDQADCSAPVAGHTYSAGAEWATATTVPDTLWRIDNEDSQILVGPAGTEVEAPCELAQVAPGGENLVAGVCTDGSAVRSMDAGASWDQSDPIMGIDALAFDGDSLLAASIEGEECADGVDVSTLDSSLQASNLSCAPAEGAEAGYTAISSASDGTLWLMAGDTVLRSADGGGSWDQ